MSITIRNEELSLEDLDCSDINIIHAFCAHCHPGNDYLPDARYLCGKQIEEPVIDGEECVVCKNISYCPECGNQLTSGFY